MTYRDLYRVFRQEKLVPIPVFVVLTLAPFSPSVWAEDEPDESSNWEFVITPYTWGVLLDGDIRVKGRETEVDTSFGDILSEPNLALMFDFEVRKDRFGGLSIPCSPGWKGMKP